MIVTSLQSYRFNSRSSSNNKNPSQRAQHYFTRQHQAQEHHTYLRQTKTTHTHTHTNTSAQPQQSLKSRMTNQHDYDYPKASRNFSTSTTTASATAPPLLPPLQQPRNRSPNGTNGKFKIESTQSPSPSPSLFTILKNLTTLFCTILITTGSITIILILYIIIRPFSLSTYRRLACTIGSAAFLDAMSLIFPNMKLFLSGDSDPLTPVGVSVLVCNHFHCNVAGCVCDCSCDWWTMLMLARCVGMRGSVKAFLQHKSYIHKDGHGNGSSPVHSTHDQIMVRGSNDGNGSATSAAGGTGGGNGGNGISSSTATSGIHTSTSAPGFLGVGASVSVSRSNLSMPRNRSQDSIHLPLAPAASHHHHHHHHHHKSSTNTNTGTNTGTGTLPKQKINWWNQCLAITFLNKFLDFPLLSSENTQNYVQDRSELFSLLRSFASSSSSSSNTNTNTPENETSLPIHLLLFPEGWPEPHTDRKTMIAKSIEFAKREGRPQLRHMLLPRTTGFYASLESLREASPVVYDVTLAYKGYDYDYDYSSSRRSGGSKSESGCCGGGGKCGVNGNAVGGGGGGGGDFNSLETLLRLIRGEIPKEAHIRIKRFSMGEVLSDPNWLDKQWKEKDLLLDHFERHGVFPVDNRGFCRHVVMDTRAHNVENSLMAFVRLGMIAFAIPMILFFSVPLLFCVGWMWVAHRSFMLLFPGGFGSWNDYGIHGGGGGGRTSRGGKGRGPVRFGEVSENSNDGGTDSATGTPFLPATPFASPTHIASWISAPANDSSSKGQKRK